jgi:integrase
MGRQHIRETRGGPALYVKQRKTGKELLIPIYPELRAVLDATPGEHLTFLVTATGKPYGDNHFSESFREWCDAAGLPKRSAHGLRKARCRWLAEHECSGPEIMANSGHETMKELVRYTKGADQARLARNALAKAITRRKAQVAKTPLAMSV